MVSAVRIADSLVTYENKVEFNYADLDEAFPKVDPGIAPLGSMVLVQIRQPKTKTKHGVILPADTRSTEHYNTQVAKVIAIGPLCFKSTVEVQPAVPNGGRPVLGRDVDRIPYQALADWPEGRWFEVGSFVRIAKYGGDRFTAPFDRVEFETDPETGKAEKVTTKDNAIFAFLKISSVLGLVTCDPRTIRAFLD